MARVGHDDRRRLEAHRRRNNAKPCVPIDLQPQRIARAVVGGHRAIRAGSSRHQSLPPRNPARLQRRRDRSSNARQSAPAGLRRAAYRTAPTAPAWFGLLEGLPNRERELCERPQRLGTHQGIAADLGISAGTVKTYRDRAFERLGIHHRNELFARAIAEFGTSRDRQMVESADPGNRDQVSRNPP